MGLFLRVRGRLLRPRIFRFTDTTPRVVFGHDPARCQVLFAKRLKAVGSEHAALERILGEYRWVLSDEYPVYVDGVRVLEGDRLPAHGVLRLGHRGPQLFFSCGENAEVPTLQPLSRLRVGASRLQGLAMGVRWNRLALITLALLVIGATTAGAMALKSRDSLRAFDNEARLRTVLNDAAPSVYRVVIRTADGAEYGGGTAWVVAPGLLATNVHVAESFDSQPAGARLLVRSTGPATKTFEVRATRLHPGYDAFDLKWRHYDPAQARGRMTILNPGTACDVALLEVDAASDLGRPLPMASDVRARTLKAGEPVGYVGYPSERLAMNGSPVRRPVPQVQTGTLTAVTTFLGESLSPSDNTLLQHSCGGTGGSSGSPLLNAEGVVVGIIHAGNFSGGWGGRIPLGVGVDFAQRIDLLRELVEGRAHETLAERSTRLQERLETLYVSAGEIERSEVREALLKRWPVVPGTDKPGYHRVFAPSSVTVVDVPRAGVSGEPVRAEVAIAPDADHAVLVWRTGDREEQSATLRLTDEQGAELPEPVPFDSTRPSYGRRSRHPSSSAPRSYQVLVGVAATLHIEIEPSDSPARFDIEVLRSDTAVDAPEPTGVDNVTVLGAWRAHLETFLPKTFRFSLVFETNGTVEEFGLQRWMWSEFVDVREPGLYLLVTRVEGGREIEIDLPADDGDRLPARAPRQGLDSCVFTTMEPRQVLLFCTVRGDRPAEGRVAAKLYHIRFPR